MKRKIIIVAVLFVIIILTASVIKNKAVEVNHMSVGSENVPKAFDGFKIVHISDLHNETFGENNEKLIAMIKNENPDIAVITGDILDSRRTDRAVAESFVKDLADIAPVYFVCGNHESRIAEYSLFRDNIAGYGAVVLEDECVEIERGEDKINILGIKDPSFEFGEISSEEVISGHLRDDIGRIVQEGYNILLSHRPEYFEVYAECGIDLVFSGHAHGGQFRLPFIGGLFAPGQGFFPEYTSGIYHSGKTSMIVSRGVGNSLFPLRINNPPEVIVAELVKLQDVK